LVKSLHEHKEEKIGRILKTHPGHEIVATTPYSETPPLGSWLLLGWIVGNMKLSRLVSRIASFRGMALGGVPRGTGARAVEEY
jgi:hypothetical protein